MKRMYLVVSSYFDQKEGDLVDFTTQGMAYSAQQAVDRNRATYNELDSFKVEKVFVESDEEWKDNGQAENTD